MITLKSKKYNTLDDNIQKKYDYIINEELEMINLRCTCGKKGSLIKHAYYYRYVRTPLGKVHLRVLRVICQDCKKTHAIMIQCIVPYSQLLIDQQIQIIRNDIKDLEELMIEYELDESYIRYIKTKYNKYWKQRLKSFDISFNETLIYKCFSYFNKQFMQIKCLSNILIT